MKTVLHSLVFGAAVAFSPSFGWATIPLPAVSAARSPDTNASVPLTPVLINQLSEELRTNSPALAAAYARTNAAALAVAGVRTWEDPMLRGGYMFAENQDMMRMDEGDMFYGVEQRLPLWGRPAAMRRMARAEFEVEVAGSDLKFQTLRKDLALALFRAALAGETVVIGEEDLVWLKKTLAAADARYRSGAGSLTEVLRLQNELARRKDQQTTARELLRQQHVSLNRLMNRPATSPWPELILPPVAEPLVYSGSLIGFASRYEPRLRQMREEVLMAEAAVDKARRERYPEVGIGVDTRNDSSNGEWRQTEVMLSFSLPIFNRGRYRADIAREDAKRKAAEFEVADMELAVREEVHGLTVKIDAARREALLYRDEIIPRSEQALASAQSAWQSGTGMFLDVLEARRMLIESRLMSARAVTEQWQMLSELVLCCGLADLEALEMLNNNVQGAKP